MRVCRAITCGVWEIHDFWTQVGIAFVLHHMIRDHGCAYDGTVDVDWSLDAP